MEEAIRKADVLIEALPYIKKFHKKIVVIKYGGSILGEEKVRKGILEDMVFLRYMGLRPVLVHGGGPNITERLRENRIVSEFVDGMRITDEQTLRIVEEELNILNDLIVREINEHGSLARGIKRDDGFIRTVKKKGKKDLGFVGEIVDIKDDFIREIIEYAIPVICPMGISSENIVYNINADEVACFIAKRLNAEKLVFLTNVLGVMRDLQDEESLISTITLKEVEELIQHRVIDEGMIPKVKAAIKAIEGNVGKVHIIDAKIPHAILLEIFTDKGIGTEIVRG